ncbi:hypothetical protein [Pedobacter steynii]
MLFLKIFCDKDKELEVLNDDYVSPIPTEYQWDSWAADDEGMTGDELQEFVDRKLFLLCVISISVPLTKEPFWYTKFLMAITIT